MSVTINKSDWVGTKAQYIALSSIEANRKYYITDLETFVITNSAMSSATSTYSSLYTNDDVFLCVDSGIYSQYHFYKFNNGSWTDLGGLVSNLPNGTYIGTGTNWGTSPGACYLRTSYFAGGQIPQKEGDLVYSTGTRNLHRCGAVTWDAQEGVYKTTPTFVANFTIPTVNNNTITITQGGVSKGYFTLNQSTNATIDLDAGGSGSGVQSNWNESDSTSLAFIQNKPTIPTKTSDLTNDGNGTNVFATSDQVFAKVYTSIASISPNLTTSSTIKNVVDAMVDNSYLSTEIENYSNLVPDSNYLRGVLEVNKVKNNFASCKYISAINTPSTNGVARIWFGEFNNNVFLGGWTGWKELTQTQFSITIKKEGTQIASYNGSEGVTANIVETDPIFSASASAGITSSDISNWNAKSDFSGNYSDLSGAPQFSYSNGVLTITL